LQNTTAWAAIPPLISSPFVIRPSHSTHLTCYRPRCSNLFTAIFIDIVLVASHQIVQLPTVCHLESCAENLTKHVDLFAASYSRLSMPPASSSPPSSSTSYSSRPTDTIHAAGILIDIVLIASYCTTSHCHLGSCTNNLTKHVDLLAASFSRLSLRLASLTAILIDIVLVASYYTTSSFVCPSESCANNLRKFVDPLTVSYSRLSFRLASSLDVTQLGACTG